MGYVWSLGVGHVALQYQRTVSVLRSLSRSIAGFWGSMIALHLFLIAFNVLIYVVGLKLIGGTFSEVPVFHLFWLNLAGLLAPYLLLRLNPGRVVGWSFRKVLWACLQILIYWIGAPFLAFLYVGSPSLGYAVLVLMIWWSVFLFGDLARVSFYRKTKLKLAGIGTLLIALIGGVSVAVTARQHPQRDFLFGHLFGEKRAWIVSDVERLKSVEERNDWYWNMSPRLKPAEALNAFLRLESLCPPEPSDEPLAIRCPGDEDRSELLRTKWKWSFEEAKLLLESKSEYASVAALVWVRRQSLPWPPEIESLIVSLGEVPGRISVVARTTLEKSRNEARFRLVIRKDQTSNP